MSELNLTIHTDHSCFPYRDEPGGETSPDIDYYPDLEIDYIVENIRHKILLGHRSASIRDMNGNKIGSWTWS